MDMPGKKRKRSSQGGRRQKWKRNKRAANTKRYTDEEIEAEQKRRYGDDPAKRAKKCLKCPDTKPLSSFPKNHGCADGLSPTCKECSCNALKEVRDAINATKIGKCCENCGYDADNRCLDYAHNDRETKARSKSGKTVSLAHLTSLARFEKEKPHMRLLCRNCHADETVCETREMVERKYPVAERSEQALRQLKRTQEKARLISNEKMLRKCCQRCKMQATLETCHRFDFDHLPGTEKIACIARLRDSGTIKAIIEEIKKCQLLCKCCHLIVTLERLEQQKCSIQLEIKVDQDGAIALLLALPANRQVEQKEGKSSIRRRRPAAQDQKVDKADVEKHLVRDLNGIVPVTWLRTQLGFRRGTQTLSKILASLNFVLQPSKHFKHPDTGRKTGGPAILGFRLKTDKDQPMDIEEENGNAAAS